MAENNGMCAYKKHEVVVWLYLILLLRTSWSFFFKAESKVGCAEQIEKQERFQNWGPG